MKPIVRKGPDVPFHAHGRALGTIVTRTEAYTYLRRGILVLLCLLGIPSWGMDYRQNPADSAFSSENNTSNRRNLSRRHIPERYSRYYPDDRRGYKNYSSRAYRPSPRRRPAAAKKTRTSLRTAQHQGHRKKHSRRYSKKKTSSQQKIIRYRIKKGDTLYSIARRYSTSVSKLRRLNGLSRRGTIRYGQKLKIPSRGKKSKIKAASQKIKKKSRRRSQKGKPVFRWPLRKIKDYRRDSSRGVRAIGLIIKARPGAAVVSSAEGTVRHIGYMRGYGNFIILQHRGRYITVYANLEHIHVSRGDHVHRGKLIGRIGRDKKLHFQIDYAGKPKNPLKFLPKKG